MNLSFDDFLNKLTSAAFRFRVFSVHAKYPKNYRLVMVAREFKKKIAEVYKIANELGRAFNIDICTPDGHLLGANGQIAAKIAFKLEFGSPKEEHNCTWSKIIF